MDKTSARVPSPILDLLTAGVGRPRRRPRPHQGRQDGLRAPRARISAAAIELFAESGYAATTVLDIAQKAGVSRKTFYELYPTKEAVFLDAYQTLGALLTKLGLGTASQQHPTSLDHVRDSTRKLLETMGANGSATQMFYLEALGAGPRVRARRNEAIDEFVDAVAPGFRELRAHLDPELPALSRRLCHLIVAASIELITEFLADHDPSQLPDLTDDLTEIIRAIAIPNHPITNTTAAHRED